MLADINEMENKVATLEKEIGVRDNQIKSMQSRVREAQEASE
jgi:chaperonin cofactor prefoldin